ncbi:hypothetical protein [Actinoplanes subtropicus]|uniref:hypothetical protein n=1 Tax=Actinoplanes subtropicus TaxID=543632 RepID=UPI0004C4673B|nr:hypothetical protein [Actinoplanes subtropicus]
MTKFHVNVCLAPPAAGDVDAALAAAMAPFDHNLTSDGNPAGEWDWWCIDGGPGSRFAVRPEHDGDPRLVYGDDEAEPLRCDGGPRGLLDFPATRRHAVERARGEWRAQQHDFRRLVADHPGARPLTAFLARHEADPVGYPRERAVADHHAQPLVRALSHSSAWERYPSLGVRMLHPDSDPITELTRDPQPDFDRAAAWAITAYALLTAAGQWIDPEQLGPFAAPRDGEAATDAYVRQADAYLDTIGDDYLIVRLLCHS